MSKWTIDGTDVDVSDEVVVTAQTLELPLRAHVDDIETWRAYQRAGDVEVRVGSGGTFVADDGRDIDPVVVEPPPVHVPPLEASIDTYVQGYDETQIGADHYRVTLTLVRTENRDAAFNTLDESDEVDIDVHRGTVGVTHRDIETTATAGSPSGGDIELSVRLTAEQAGVVLDSLTHPEGISHYRIPGGDDIAEDDSPDGRQTVTLFPARDRLPTQGGAIATSASPISPDRWRVELTLAELETLFARATLVLTPETEGALLTAVADGAVTTTISPDSDASLTLRDIATTTLTVGPHLVAGGLGDAPLGDAPLGDDRRPVPVTRVVGVGDIELIVSPQAALHAVSGGTIITCTLTPVSVAETAATSDSTVTTTARPIGISGGLGDAPLGDAPLGDDPISPVLH